MEVVLSYILVQVVLNSAVDSDCKNVLAPLAIGFTIMVDICAGYTAHFEMSEVSVTIGFLL